MENSNFGLTQAQVIRLRRKFMKMPSSMICEIAEEYEVDVASRKNDAYSISNEIVDGLSPEDQKELLLKYGDAGRASTFIYKTRKNTSSLQVLYEKAIQLIEPKSDSELHEYYPYINEVEIDDFTETLRIRFFYLHGSIRYIERDTGKLVEHRNYWDGVVVLKGNSSLMEIRVKHRTMARKLSIMIPTFLGIAPFMSLSLKDPEMNNKFVDWITSLNSATIEMSTKDEHASIIITAHKGIDLRTGRKYHQELKMGTLQAGHVTINREKDKINFHSYFRDCHLKFTLFTSDENIRYVVDSLEKISEGFNFGRPEKMLTEYFDKKD